MKKGNRNKISHTIKKWRPGDYIRQLSIVIAGIVVTFIGSDIISDYSRQKEVASVMQLVKSELEYNREKLTQIKSKIDTDSIMSVILLERNLKYQDIPEDTLIAYVGLLQSTASFKYSQNALTMLQNSSLMQYIPDKAFLLSLIQTYESLRGIEAEISVLYTKKIACQNEALNELTNEDRVAINRGGIKEFYRVLLSSQKMVNYIYTVPAFFDEGAFEDVYSKLDESIRGIDRKYE